MPDDVKEVIPASADECLNPNCQKPHGKYFQCPCCQGGFCNQCFEPDLDGNGTTLRCPLCHAKLRFPQPAEVAPLT